MKFFKIRLQSNILATVITTFVLAQCGGSLFAQGTSITVNSLSDLKTAFSTIAAAGSGSSFQIQLGGAITMDGSLSELHVPAGVTVDISGGGIDGDKAHRGLVIQTETGASVNISEVAFKNCVAAGGDGGNGQVGGGGGAGLGGALYIRGTDGNVNLTDVTFANNKSVGGNGGEAVSGSTTAGGGGGLGGDGGGSNNVDSNYAAGGGGGFGENAFGGTAAVSGSSGTITNGGAGTSSSTTTGGQGYSPSGTSGGGLTGTGGANGGGGAGSYGVDSGRYAAGGGGGEGGKNAGVNNLYVTGGEGGYGGGGGGSTQIGGKGGFGGGGGGGNQKGGDGGFGGGGGGSLDRNNVGGGGLGAGNGGYEGGGGGLGAGGALYVEGGVTVSVNYTKDQTSAFSKNASEGGLGAGDAGSGDALGAIFLNGNKVAFGATGAGTTATISGDISDISAASNFDKTKKDAVTGKYDLETYGGGVSITGGIVTLTGNNTYAGVTQIDAGTTLIADGKAVTDSTGKTLKDGLGHTIYNAIGDLSEVHIDGNGKLELAKSETIGFLSSDSMGGTTVELKGKTLTIAGDEDPAQFGKGINPATGLPVDAFTGKIANDTAGGQLVKTGTGRLTLTGDNSNPDEFTTTIYQGTIALKHAKGLGGGDVTVKNTDTGTGQNLRNVIEAGAILTGANAVMNDFNIVRSGKNLNGVQQDFNAMVVGGGYDIQFGNAVAQGGKISGGNLLVNMDNAANKVVLANEGYDSTSMGNIDARRNNYGETQIKKGTVVVSEYDYKNSAGAIVKGTTLGSGSVHAVGAAGDAILSADTPGMTISNNLVMDAASTLTLTNTGSFDFFVSGSTSGKGGLIVDLFASTNSVTMTGAITHTGTTDIKNGKLIIAPATARNSTALYNLSASSTGALEVQSGDLYVDVTGTATYAGTLTMASGKLVKTGSGTWVFDRTSGLITDSIEVNDGTLQLNRSDNVSNVLLSGVGHLKVNADATLANLTSNSLTTNVTINDGRTLTLNASGDLSGDRKNILYNTWTGGETAMVVFKGDTVLQNLYQKPTDWKGTMEVGANAKLTVNSPGGLGDAENAQVTLNTDSKLVIDTYKSGYSNLYADQIKTLNVAGNSTVDVKGGSNFITETLDGSADVTKDGPGTWTMQGDSSGSFTGNVNLAAGGIYLQRSKDPVTGAYAYGANWGDGDLNVTGADTALVIDHGDGPKDISNNINLDETLNVFVYDYSTTGGSANLSGAVTGAGGINYQGSGTLVFDGTAKTYTGDTNVNGGILRVETNTTTDYYVNGGGTLDLQNVALGGKNVTVKDGGTLQGTVATGIGDLNFAAGSKLIADYSGGNTPKYTADNVTITDGATAHIAGATAALNETLIHANTGYSGMFWFTDDIQGKRAVGNWSGGNDLVITFEDVNYADNAYTSDALNMASYLNAIGDNSINGRPWNPGYPVETGTASLLNALENINPGQYDYALLEIGGQINPSLVTAHVQTTTNMFQSVVKQLYPISYFAESCDEGYAVSGGNLYRGQSMRSGWTGWSSGLGIIGDTSGNSNRGTFGYDFNSYGMAVGIEPTSAMSPNRLGFFYAYSYTDIGTNKSIGNGHVKDNFFGAYGRFVDGLGYTSFVAGFGFDNYVTNRNVTVPGNGGYSRSDFDGWQGGLYIERGLNHLTLTRLGLQPYVGLQYLYTGTDAFDETGDNPYRLETDSSDVNSLRSNLGIRLARQVCRVKRGTMFAYGNVSWMHEFLDADCVMASKWGVSGNPSTFGVVGNSLGRDWAVLGVGLDWNLRQNLSVFGSYDLQVNGYQTLNIGNIGARIQW